jgi:phosphoglycolate phosphatase-like HAD superfamily hydrolase
MVDLSKPLSEFRKRKSYFVGIDSDGCVFDTMELKHKECFIPNTIYYYGLQSVSKYAREVAEFVNLYSEWRGINRFPGLVLTLEMLGRRPEVLRRGVQIRDTSALSLFMDSGKPLGNPALLEEVARTGDPDLKLALEWSESVNRDIARLVHGVKPFPGVRESLERLVPKADLMVISGTPAIALASEWEEHDLTRFVDCIAGQEVGSKVQTVATAAAQGYDRDKMLIVGDAPGDLEAAKAHHCRFFPIIPGQEDESWERLLEDGLPRFLGGHFAGDYEDSLVESFVSRLPGRPPWES